MDSVSYLMICGLRFGGDARVLPMGLLVGRACATERSVWSALGKPERFPGRVVVSYSRPRASAVQLRRCGRATRVSLAGMGRPGMRHSTVLELPQRMQRLRPLHRMQRLNLVGSGPLEPAPPAWPLRSLMRHIGGSVLEAADYVNFCAAR
jgi:hypothetical protein